jgi:hypothetical protein
MNDPSLRVNVESLAIVSWEEDQGDCFSPKCLDRVRRFTFKAQFPKHPLGQIDRIMHLGRGNGAVGQQFCSSSCRIVACPCPNVRLFLWLLLHAFYCHNWCSSEPMFIALYSGVHLLSPGRLRDEKSNGSGVCSLFCRAIRGARKQNAMYKHALLPKPPRYMILYILLTHIILCSFASFLYPLIITRVLYRVSSTDNTFIGMARMGIFTGDYVERGIKTQKAWTYKPS